MTHWLIDFDAPGYLVLLLLLPVFWLVGRRSLQALGPWRRRVALALRLLVAGAIIVALAEPNWLSLARRLTVLFVVDGSASVDHGELARALEYVNAAADDRDTVRGDRAGVVVFGREAQTEVPPADVPWHVARIESQVDPRFTNLGGALQMAAATFPPDTAKRVVIISDGNENLGDAAVKAGQLAHMGIGIDVVPIAYQRRGDVVVEKVVAPTEIRRGAPFALRVVLDNLSPDHAAAGTLRITRDLAGSRQVIAEQPVTLEPGKHVLAVRQELADSGMSTYEATFVPDQPADDSRLENNEGTAFCRVSGRGQVLLIEDALQPGRFDTLVELLQGHDIEVTVRDTRRPFDNLADLQQFDTVLLADVPRVAGEGADEIMQLSDAQIHMLVQNTEHFGAGLVVLGGPNSFGAGGWTNTELEKALPVDFQIDNAKVDAVGALVLVIDSSGSMTGEKISWSKAAAAAAVEMLGRRDYIGVVSFDSEAHWIVPVRRNGSPDWARSRISRLGAGGGTDLTPAQRQAYDAIRGTDASIKHVIVLTDGQTPPSNHVQLAAKLKAENITTSGVAVGPDADRLLLERIARAGGGKFYYLKSPNAIPRIFMREARRVAMPLVFEDRNGFGVQVASHGEVLTGINDTLPPITGYVLTTVKDNPLVDVLLATPRQPGPNSTILATWPYGSGRAAALTTDVGQRWAADWPAWDGYDKLMLQLVRWSMRGGELNEQLVMSTDVRDGVIEVVANALDPDDARVDFLHLSGMAVAPSGEEQSFALEQVAPGRYVGRLEAGEPGNYFLSVSDGSTAPLRTAVHITRTAEFDRLVSNEQMLAQLAEERPADGEPGEVIYAEPQLADVPALLETSVFRPGVPPAERRDTMWPLVVLVAGGLFFGDVLCRRVLISFAWVPQLMARLPWAGRPSAEREESPQLARLKRSKAEVTAGWRRTEPDVGVEPTASATAIHEATTAAKPRTTEKQADKSDGDDAADEASDYTSRLLAAKRRAREGHDRRDKPAG